MQISAADLNNLSIPINGNITLGGNCLDHAREAPTSKTHLNYINNYGEKIFVIFEDSYQQIPLAELLGKENGIDFVGSNREDEVNLIKEARRKYDAGESIDQIRSEIKFPLHLINRTGKNIHIVCQENIQLGEFKEPYVETYGATSQNEIWVNSSLKQLCDIGYNKYTNSNQLSEFISKNSFDSKEKLLIEIVRKFEKENHLKETGDLNSKDTKNAFNLKYNKYLHDKATRDEKEKMSFFSNNNIGIKGKNSNEIIKYYTKSNGLSGDISWDDFKIKYKKDFDSHIVYLYDITKDNYYSFIKSRKIDGLLLSKTEYVISHLNQLEDILFINKLDLTKVYILNFLSKSADESTYEILEKKFSGQFSDYSLFNLSIIKQKIKAKKTDCLICFGHFENGNIYLTGGDKDIPIDLTTLFKLGKELGVKIIPIGCESSFAANGKIGTTKIVNSYEILNLLFSSLENSKSYGDFLSSYVKNGESKYSFVWEFDEITQVIKISAYEKYDRKKSKENKGQFNESKFEGEKRGNYSSPSLAISFPKSFFIPLINKPDDNDKNK